MFRSQFDIDAINKKHLVQIRSLCDEVIKTSSQSRTPRAPVLEYDGARSHAVDDRDHDEMGALLAIPENQDCHKLTIAQVLESADIQHSKLLECPWYVSEESNKDLEVAKHIHANVPELLKKIPHRCRDFDLLSEQRLAIASIIDPLPVETWTNLKIPRSSMEQLTPPGCRKQEFCEKYYLERNRLPMFTVADLSTGSGKTIMAIMAALIMLVDVERWANMKKEFKDILYSRRREQYSGLVSGTGIESMCLARLCICYVPGTVVTHWYRTAESAIFGIRETFGADTKVNLWKGKSTHHSIRAAYELDQPVLWILPMEASSLDVELKFPECVYPVRIMDELNVKMQKKYQGEMSSPLFTYIVRSSLHTEVLSLFRRMFASVLCTQTQATIGALQTCTRGMPRHPIRRAFGDNFVSTKDIHTDLLTGNYKRVEVALDHLCKISHFAMAKFVRLAVSKGIQRNMPSGLHIYRLKMRVSTIANIVTGSVMDLSFPELVAQMLVGINAEWKDRIKEIFNKAVVLDSAQVLDDIDNIVERIEPTNLQDHTAKQFIMRLAIKLREIFEGTLPDDPVTLEPIPRENLCLLRCCTGVIDKNTLPMLTSRNLGNRCPLCRSPLHAVEITGDASKVYTNKSDEAEKTCAEKSGSNASGKRRAESPSLQTPKCIVPEDSEDEQESIQATRVDEERKFHTMLRGLSNENLHAVEALMRLLKNQCESVSSSRILLCFGFERSQKPLVHALLTRIRQEIQLVTVTDIDYISRDYIRADEVLSKYKNRVRYPNPQILIVNTRQTSSSVQGLDLFETDLTVVADQCSLETQRQAAGRCLRMRELVNNKPFGPKKIVVTTMHGTFNPIEDVESDYGGLMGNMDDDPIEEHATE